MLRPMLHGAASAGLACVFLIAVDWRLGLVTVAVAAVVWFAYNRLMRQYRVAERQKGERNEHGAAEVLEFAQVQPVLRMAGPDSLGSAPCAPRFESSLAPSSTPRRQVR